MYTTYRRLRTATSAPLPRVSILDRFFFLLPQIFYSTPTIRARFDSAAFLVTSINSRKGTCSTPSPSVMGIQSRVRKLCNDLRKICVPGAQKERDVYPGIHVMYRGEF